VFLDGGEEQLEMMGELFPLKTFVTGIDVHGTSETPVERRQDRQAHMYVMYFAGLEGISRALASSLVGEA
jgi:hypothetical protein